MTDKQWWKYAEAGMKVAAKQIDEATVKRHSISEWINEQKRMYEKLESRRESGYYDNNPDEALKDWTDLYVARIICYQASNNMVGIEDG